MPRRHHPPGPRGLDSTLGLPPPSSSPPPPAYDSKGDLIGELGVATPPILAAIPLPLAYCWGHLLIAALRLGCAPAARRAAAQLVPLFVRTSPGRPLWEAHPMDALSLRQDAAAAAAAPLLRAFAQASLAHVARLRAEAGAAEAAAAAAAVLGAAGARGSKGLLLEHREPKVEAQVALLRDCKRALIAMEVR